MGIIYRATCVINGKFYIGKSLKSLSAVKSRHYSHAIKQNTDTKFYRAVRKYKWDNFKWEILKNNILPEELSLYEMWFISTFDAKVNGYNSTDGGEHTNAWLNLTQEESDVWKQKLRETFSRCRTEQSIEKIRNSLRGRKLSPASILQREITKKKKKQQGIKTIYVCSKCNEKFDNPGNMGKHVGFVHRNVIPRQKLEKICQICNKKFITIYSDAKFCSRDCFYKHLDNSKKITICLVCKKEVPACKFKKYCSVECRTKGQVGKILKPRIQRKCKNCDIEMIFLPKKEKEFCSTQCFQEFQKTNNTKTIECKTCKKKITVPKSYKQRQFCSIECYGLSMKGKPKVIK